MSELIILLPVYEDRDCLKELLRDIARVPMPAVKFLVVDDGSIHTPPDPNDLRDAGLRGEVVRLHRNLGQQRAIAIGLALLRRKLPHCPVLVMDADGEDRVDAISELIGRFENGDAEIVVAQRGRQTKSLIFQLFYRLYKILFWLLTGRIMNFGTFALLSNGAVSRLTAMPELTIHFAASVLATGLPLAFVSVDRGHRYVGASRMSYLSRLMHAMRSIMVFPESVLLRVGVFWGAAAGLMLLVAGPIMKRSSPTTLGWFTTVADPLIMMFLAATVVTVLSMIIAGIAWVARRNRRYSADALLERAVTVSFCRDGERSS